MTTPSASAEPSTPKPMRATASGAVPGSRSRPHAVRTTMTTPMAATVAPMSSLTRTSGAAHSIAAYQRRRMTASREKAMSGTAERISGEGDGGERERGGLRDEQRDRAREDPVERGEEGRDGAEVVAEDVGAGALE